MLLYRRMAESIDSLRSLSRILADHSIKLREAAETALARGAVLREVSQLLHAQAAERREQAEAARTRRPAD